jgi:hypothetical protein
MKKILFFLALTVAVSVANAQIIRNLRTTLVTVSGTVTQTVDTVTNTGSKSSTAYHVVNWFAGATVQTTITKISGTVGGTLGLYGSSDGTGWTLVGSSQTPGDGSATYAFSTTVAYPYFRVTYAGTGTMTASFKTYLTLY